ncbi:MAG: intradiol ring-cleavage dioxygenase [Verrucomicrobia bacterium]|nr:intradiol ring-cleavage dioxygenase [Verrucomicrobiota bacterium]
MNAPSQTPLDLTRRRFAKTLGAAAAGFFSIRGAYAAALMTTPAQTEGPFYPDKLPLDTDNDLLVINDSITPSVGQVAWVSGKILDASGAPIRNALVEIWQADANGAYLHSKSGNGEKRDGHFQGFGRFLTGSTGEYLFRTIRPVPYPGRTPHIHFMVKVKGREKFTTQCYIKGEKQNDTDGVLKGIKDPKARSLLIVPFDPLPRAHAGEVAASFNIVLGQTPAH